MKDFLSVKEFSKFTGINITTLRYWDKVGLFSPAKRGGKNNYRYYSLQQIVMINFINVLTELEIPIKTMHSINQNKNPKNILSLLENQVYLLDRKLNKIQEMYSIIHTRCELIRLGLDANQKGFSVVDLPEKAIILGPPNKWIEGQDFYEPFNNFYKESERLNINPRFPIGGLHESIDDFFDTTGQPNRFFSLDPLGNSKQKAGKYLVGFARGYYGKKLTNVTKRMKEYAKNNSLNLTSPIYVIYLHDEICIQNPNRYLAQICIPIKN